MMKLIPLANRPKKGNRLIAWHVLWALHVAYKHTPVLATKVTEVCLVIDSDMNASAVVSELHQHGHAKKVSS